MELPHTARELRRAQFCIARYSYQFWSCRFWNSVRWQNDNFYRNRQSHCIRPVAQTLNPEMIKVGRRHAAMKNNAHETIIKRYVVQVSRNFTLALDRSNSAAAISNAASGSPTPTTNIRIEG